MNLTLAHIGAQARTKSGSSAKPTAKPVTKPQAAFDAFAQTYLDRCSTFARCQTQAFRSEEAFHDWLTRQQGRTPVLPVLLDSRGRQMTSEAFATWLGARRDEGVQHIVFAVGPADGWTEAARAKAQLLLSFGSMTLAHGLARLVLAEQLYRAFTILTGHPYHSGH
jgi:23S rRNA (pseudouridine1915-N3)-methyltransferase